MIIVLTTKPNDKPDLLSGFNPSKESKPTQREAMNHVMRIRRNPHKVLDHLRNAYEQLDDALEGITLDVDGAKWEFTF